MTFRIVRDAAAIEEHVTALRERLTNAASWRGRHWVGFPGGRDELDVAWHAKHALFTAFQDLDNRSWNALGTTEPGTRNTLPLIVEINFPWEGLNRQIGGVFLEGTGSRDIAVAHRGGIGGGRKGVGKTAFFKHFCGRVIDAEDGDRFTPVAVVASLNSRELLPAIATFVREVDRIKDRAVNGGEVDLPAFTPEFEGTKQYQRAASNIVYEARHGTVVEALASELEATGHQVANDRERDLFVPRGRKHVKHLFEVKTVVSTTAIYTAVGQLLVNGRSRDESANLYLVLPLKPTRRFRTALTNLGISPVVYDWNEGEPTFSGLPACR
ncbi:MAG: hypothetical protein EVA89_31895 [Sandaracinaceae bacterium]|nr:MAG: hypothetical protein EVA89_31895 [Sandaracinaceae bacterium]